MMESFLFVAFGIVISCVILSVIIFQFMEERYERVYQNKVGYILFKIGTCVSIMLVNTMGNPIANMSSIILLFSINAIFLYQDIGKKVWQRVIEVIALILVLSLCETVGYLLLEFVLWKFGIDNISSEMFQCLNMTFSKLVIILLYYSVVSPIWKKKSQNRFTLTQYIVYIVMIIYSVANFAVIFIVVSGEMANSFTERLLLLINMSCIVFADLYFVYFTKFTEENAQLKLKLKMLEQQAELQYEYYAEQEEKYNESVKILHDVNKHLNMIQDIYEMKQPDEARKYADEIRQILQPLILQQYINNPILNIILNDKSRYASRHDIEFKMEIGDVDLSFMEPIEITTIFGNLLDNAIEACEAVKGKSRMIHVKLDEYNDFVVINISNTSVPVTKWAAGKPISQKGKNHGIGLINVENVVKKYHGNMVLEEKEEIFSCNIVFNS